MLAAEEGMPKTSRAGAWFAKWKAEKKDEDGYKEFAEAFTKEFLSAERNLKWNGKFQERLQKVGVSPTQYLKELRDMEKLANKSEMDIHARFKTGLQAEIADALAPLRLKTLNDVLESAEQQWEHLQRTQAKGRTTARVTAT